ncbi:MAG: hypothetical protein ACRDHG_06200 [Anaerolineales bacterium]
MDELSRGKLIALSLVLLEENDRRQIEHLAQMLQNEIPMRSPARVQFGPLMAYELLWAVGRWISRNSA